MPEWLSQLGGFTGFIAGLIGLVIAYRNLRKTSPIEDIRKENHDKWQSFYRDKWDKAIVRIDAMEDTVRSFGGDQTRERFERIDEKLDNDHRRINAIIETSKSQQRFLVLLLKSQQQALAHLAEGNHKTSLMQLSEEIQGFLLHEATKCDL